MRFYTCRKKDEGGLFVCIGSTGDENYVYPLHAFGIECSDMNHLIPEMNDALRQKLENQQNCSGQPIALKDLEVCAPIPEPMQDVICLGINYMEHAAESAKFKGEDFNGQRPYAVYFSKRVTRAPGPYEDIPSHSDITSSLDYEAELAVIIGKDAKNVKQEDAFDYVFGYTILNDISARDIQNRHKQFYFGKSLDGANPMGPCIVTKDEFPLPLSLKVKSYVNGELRQNSSTDKLIFGIDYIIQELSGGMTLKAGTIISTGTPSGVGMGFQPPKFLKSGDTVACEIEGIGSLRNKVV
ncbi:MAG: fumarylacetoacetate hydrolase family protein [Clostridiaceae bacterium]